ncbi:MAG: hypothetical protein IJN68_06495, partial [Clostridia bacterium]|nr:hypothetical protein [Clostridia bacterium]
MVRTSNPDHFCIVLPFFRPLGVPLYAFGAKKKASCTFLNSPTACRKCFSTSWCGVISLRFCVKVAVLVFAGTAYSFKRSKITGFRLTP